MIMMDSNDWMIGRTDGWMDGWIDGWMDHGRVCEWMIVCMSVWVIDEKMSR
jgi:hypothetical protein